MDDFSQKNEISVLTNLLDQSKLYKDGTDFQELLDFIN